VTGILLGLSLGALASAIMYPLLFPVARGSPLPPEVFVAQILRRPPTQARFAGALLQLVFGAFWGLALALSVGRVGPIGNSVPAQGLLIGLAAFCTSLAGFATLRLLETPLDWRAWTGHLLNHLVFGLTLGLLFLAFG
jgi:hypothetical protein